VTNAFSVNIDHFMTGNENIRAQKGQTTYKIIVGWQVLTISNARMPFPPKSHKLAHTNNSWPIDQEFVFLEPNPSIQIAGLYKRQSTMKARWGGFLKDESATALAVNIFPAVKLTTFSFINQLPSLAIL
jgi:hypothetical protein